MSFNPLDSLLDKLGEQRARTTPMQHDHLRMYLKTVCKSCCDRVPLKVRNLGVPFYFAGVNDTHIFLAHAETCMVSHFAFDDLEPVTLGAVEEIQELIIAWLDSAEGVAARELIDSARMASQAGVRVPVTIRWPVGGNQRQGFLTLDSVAHGEAKANWICAVETMEGKNVAFRYGLTRIARAMHDGKTLTMMLKPGTIY